MHITTASGFVLHWDSGKWGAFKQGVEMLGCFEEMTDTSEEEASLCFVPLVPQKLNLAVWFYVCRRWVFPPKPSVVIIPHRIRSSRKCALLNIYISEAVSTRNNCCAVYAFQELCVSRKGNVDGWGGVRGSSPPAGRRNWIYSFISQVLLKMFTVAKKSCLGFGFLVMCPDDDYEIRNPIGK